MDRKKISRILNEIGIMLELLGENPFKVRAYYNGARIVELLDENIETMIKEGRLGDVEGIGKALRDKIEELVNTGRMEYYENLKNKIPEGIFDILRIPGLGPKKIRQLYEQLEITTIGELEYACLENRLIELKGFGAKTQNKILEGINHLKKYRGRFLISEALQWGNFLLDTIKNHPAVLRCSLAGSLRRKKEIVKDIDILVSTNDEERQKVIDFFTSIEGIEQILEKGETKASVRLTSGIRVDFRIVNDIQYPYALHHFTGSKEHNTAMRHRAKEMAMKMNEYGLFDEKGNRIACKDEGDLFYQLKLQYIPPELRENNGEIQAAEKGFLPTLVKEKDIKGIFHVHTNYSDGTNTLKEIVTAARKIGYSYIGISDHSKSAFYAHGLKADQVKIQHMEIDHLNQELSDIHIFKGIESDILPDGSLDYDESILSQFDYVIASVHNHFNMSKEQMTERIIRAVENQYTRILGHPSGRLLLSREEYPIDIEKILKACKLNNVCVEINGNPHRLDLDWRFCKIAMEMGIKITIEPDAHDIRGLDDVYYGIGIARKGWLRAEDIINTSTKDKIIEIFKK